MPDTKPNFLAFGQRRGVYLRVSAFDLWRFLQNLTSDLNLAELLIVYGEVNGILTLRKLRGVPVEANLGGVSLKTFSGGVPVKKITPMLYAVDYTKY